MWYSGMGSWMIVGIIGTVVFWGIIIFLVVWGIKKLTEQRGGTLEKRTPLDIAKERYAKGEISKEQYEQIKKDLSG